MVAQLDDLSQRVANMHALGYELNEKWTLSAGYRYMAVNYRPDTHIGFIDDTATSGIIVGATWNIK